MDADLEVTEALGMRGARLTLSQLANLYLEQWTGKDASHHGKVKFWIVQLGNKYLPDITTDHIRVALHDHTNGYALRWNGSRANITDGHQQVNNGTQVNSEPRVGKNVRQPNELLEAQHDEGMDIREEATTDRDNSTVEAGEQSIGPKTDAGKSKASRNAYKGEMRPMLRGLATV